MAEKLDLAGVFARDGFLCDRGGLCVAQHGLFNWEKRGLCFFLNVPCIHMQPFVRRVLGSMLRQCTASTPVSSSFEWSNFVDRSSRSTGARKHAATLHGIDPGQIIVRVSTRSLFHVRTFSSSLILLTVLPCCACACVGNFISLTPPPSPLLRT